MSRWNVLSVMVTSASLVMMFLGCGVSPECDPGSEQRCGMDLGACRAGWQVCSADGRWGECLGAVEPSEEECDGVDNDCNGHVDDLQRACQNSCGTEGVEACVNGEWFCDVLNPLEECDDELDNDCDGSIDEGCACQQGFQRRCGTDVGTCVAGEQYCKDGYWTGCQGAIGPEDEVCDALDNDCDGEVDEELERPCQAPCGPGVEICEMGQWVNCTTDITSRACYTACGEGEETCLGGVWGDCDAPQPQEEIQDGIDNDCDSLIDEGTWPGDTQSCGSGVGECVQGTQTFQENGTWSECEGAVGPTDEVQDGLDNDCDGQVDEGNWPGDTQACGSGVGECVEGTQTFQEDGTWSECEGSVGPSPEILDGLDNDCDGQADDCPLPGCTQPCGYGVCAGEQTFQEDFTWGECLGGGEASAEGCDGLDNDCDGSVDEGLSQPCTNICGAGQSYCQGGGYGDCQVPLTSQPCVDLCGLEGTRTCTSGAWNECVSSAITCENECGVVGYQRCENGVLTDCSAPPVSDELCNGLDDDCDGETDELWPEKGDPCTITEGLCEAEGVLVCNQYQNGLRCDADIQGTEEECNGIDDDCDGSVDEDLTQDCEYECSDQAHTIRTGTQDCQNAGWTACVPDIPCPH